MSQLESLKGRKYPSKEHASRVLGHYVEKTSKDKSEFAIYIAGEAEVLIPYCDQTKPFRQNRYFFYLSGCNIPGSHVLYYGDSDKLVLYLPDVDKEDIMWSGLPTSIDEAYAKYDVDEVKFGHDLELDLSLLVAGKVSVLTTDINDFNKLFSPHLTLGGDDFFYALDESRLIKDQYELELMRHAARITDNCHLAVMSAIPIETEETHIHAEFTYHALRQGSKAQAYDPICCSGTSCSTLHYVKNDQPITAEKHSILIDAGAEWENYASDVTRCFPINGDWKEEHLAIYNIVLRMQNVTKEMIKPGASWEEIHLTAHRVMIEEFLNLGIFKKEYSVQELFDAKMSARFFPHGLGHLLGMDTHDVGGNPNYSDPDPLLQYLRLRRPLQAGMTLTDEPGVYFLPFLLEDVLNDPSKNKYIDRPVLDKYWYVGGVRIEDDLLVTDTGYENFTKITNDPKEITEIIKKGLAKGKEGFHIVI